MTAAVRTWDSTVWIEGISSPCATPTATRAAIVAATLSAVPGVSRHAVDHIANDAMSVRRPPHRWAAQPPGTCKGTAHQEFHVLLKPIAPCAAMVSATLGNLPDVSRHAVKHSAICAVRAQATQPLACSAARRLQRGTAELFPDHLEQGHARSGRRRMIGRPSARAASAGLPSRAHAGMD